MSTLDLLEGLSLLFEGDSGTMAHVGESSASLGSRVGARQSMVNRWATVGVVPQHSENADTVAEATVKWQAIYRLFDASSEAEQDEVFAAVCMYFLKNGCSPAGKYRKPIETAGGRQAGSGDVVAITGKLKGEIRQFMRARLEESYMFLKHNTAVVNDPGLRVAAENAGVPQADAWLLADWLGRDCPYFVGDEAEVYNKLRVSKIAVARAKQITDLGDADKVMAAAPESKMRTPPTTSYESYANNDLF